jgi:hypothetical protein
MTPLVTGLIVSTFVAVIGGFAIFFRALNSQMTDLRLEVRELRTQVSPLWAKVQAQIASDLHHPHPRYLEMDGLLEKLESLNITNKERARLKILLLERSSDMHEDISNDQREKALLMIKVMDMVLVEAAEKTI